MGATCHRLRRARSCPRWRRSAGSSRPGSSAERWSTRAHPSPKFATAVDAISHRFEAVDRRGKYLIARLDRDRELIVHLGMTGSLRIADDDAPPDPYVRAAWTLDDGAVLELRDVRRFGRIAVVPAGVYDSLPTLHALGPEPLSDDFDPLAFHRALKASRRPVKTQLMSQRPVAGVGNIYADEALWRGRASRVAQDEPAAIGSHPHRVALRAHRRDRAGRNDAARLPHLRRRLRPQPGVPRVLRPRGPAVPALRHRAAARGDRPTGHDLVPAVPAAPMTTSDKSPATDRARLVGAAYATPGPLLARAALYAYERNPVDLASWVLDRVEAEHPISAESRVLDIGCGPGRYLAALRERHPGVATVGLDLSPGMAAATLDTGTPAAVADAMQLPDTQLRRATSRSPRTCCTTFPTSRSRRPSWQGSSARPASWRSSPMVTTISGSSTSSVAMRSSRSAAHRGRHRPAVRPDSFSTMPRRSLRPHSPSSCSIARAARSS